MADIQDAITFGCLHWLQLFVFQFSCWSEGSVGVFGCTVMESWRRTMSVI